MHAIAQTESVHGAQSQLWRNKRLLFPTACFLLHNNRAGIIRAVHLENLMKSLFFFFFSCSNQSAAFAFRLRQKQEAAAAAAAAALE